MPIPPLPPILLLLQYMVAPTPLVPTGLPITPEPARSELWAGWSSAEQEGLTQNKCLTLRVHTTSAPPLAAASVRLVHPSRTNKTAGRLEVKHGSWGTVCSDGFNNAAASVVCRQVRC